MKEPTSRILQGLEEALAHAAGRPASGVVVHVPDRVDVRAIRRSTGLTQTAFADRIGVSVATLRNWEQGRRRPEGPARVLLSVIAGNPRIVEETLGSAA